MEEQQAEFTYLRVDALRDSPTNPRDPNEELDPEFVESIRQNDIIQPLIVRPITENGDIAYEIAAGHRRRKGFIAAELSHDRGIPCIIRQLTDEQMIDFHIQENIHRKDLGPMEEAKVYALLRERCRTLNEMALRAGKSDTYIAQRLKLNDLIPELQADLIAGHLPLRYALTLAKYGADAQQAAMGELYGGEWGPGGEYIGYVVDDNDGTVTDPKGEDVTDEALIAKIHASLEENDQVWIADKSDLQVSAPQLENFLLNRFTLRLDAAIFDINDARLRQDKLTCPKCTERTGANATLFDLGEDTPDFCLNRACFEAKTLAFVQIVRTNTAKKAGVAVEQVPLVHQSYGQPPEGFLSRSGVEFLDFEQEEPDEHCESEQVAIYNAQPVTVCLVSSGCKVHHWQNRENLPLNAQISPEEAQERQVEAKQARKEELWNIKVGEETRLRVITEAATKFAGGVELIFDGNTAMFTSIIAYAAARFWQTIQYNDLAVLAVFKRFTGKVGIELPSTDYRFNYEAAVQAFSETDIRKLFYLFTHYWKGDMRNNRWTDQTPVKELAARHAISYELVDAQVRVDLSAKKHEKRHKAYLQQIEVKDPDARIPLLYTQVEKPVEKDVPTGEAAVPVEVEEVEEAEITVYEVGAEEYQKMWDAYSADKIANNSSIRQPFDYAGKRWTNVGGQTGVSLEALQIVAKADYKGETHGYGDAGYEGMVVQYIGHDYVLTGRAMFQVAEAPVPEPVATPEIIEEVETPITEETAVDAAEGQETPNTAISVVCPRCMAAPGQPCSTEVYGRPHVSVELPQPGQDFHIQRQKLFSPVAVIETEPTLFAATAFTYKCPDCKKDFESEIELAAGSSCSVCLPGPIEQPERSLSDIFDEAIQG